MMKGTAMRKAMGLLMKVVGSYVLLLVLLSVSMPFWLVAQKANTVERLDAYITPFADAGHFSGVILAAKEGTLVYEKAFGYALADFKIPNSPQSLIGIASITKPMTQIILVRLVDEKKIAWEDKVKKYLPQFPNGDKITVDMLTRHRSGIPHRVMKPEEEALPHTSEDMVEKIAQAKLLFEPGAQRLYSSAGYTLLARILEIASGKSYSQLLQEYVFTPAGMKESLDFNGEIIMEHRAQDYLLDRSGMVNAPLKDYSFLVGAGSVFSTARDVYRFGEAVANGTFGEAVTSNFIRDNVFSANGQTNGHRAFLKVDVGKKYVYVLLSNLASGANDMILAGMDAILGGEDVAVPAVVPNPKFTEGLELELAEYVGQYQREGGGGGFEVQIHNNMLFAGDIKLYPTGTDCFFEYRYYGNVCFVREGSEKMKEIRWDSPTAKSVWIKQ